MPRITISISAENHEKDQLLTLDVPEDLTIASLKDLVEADTSFPASTQHFFLNGNAIRADSESKTLKDLGIKEGELLAMIVNMRSAPGSSRRGGRPGSSIAPEPDNARIEEIRNEILATPSKMAELIQQAPDLAGVIRDSDLFRQAWMVRKEAQERAQRERENEIEMLNGDMFNPEAQKKIEQTIRMEQIQNNYQYAYEHNPAVFFQVTMLYVSIKVNNHPVKALVDSGAQTTIMSPSLARACGIEYLIDERFAGVAHGVGTARILGKVHNAKMQVGDAELDCAFTVMEGKNVDFLLGLDMLKRHQACIDLEKNVLRFPHTQVPFLPENEIPNLEATRRLDEPTVKGPNGLEIGAESGAVRPAGTAAAAHERLEKAKAAEGSSSSGAVSGPSAQNLVQPSSSSIGAGPSSGAPRASRYKEADITQLINLGFSREDAMRALDVTGGNVEYAAGLLFSQ